MVALVLRGICCLLLVLPVSVALCSEAPVAPPGEAPGRASQQAALLLTPGRHEDYDEVTARLPLAQAPVASVALARINVALHQARQRAGQQLCADQWTPSGALYLEWGPQLEEHSPATTRAPYWSYRSLRQPSTAACQGISRDRFFQEMSRHLPDWITVRPAGREIAYRQGQGILPSGQSRIAAK